MHGPAFDKYGSGAGSKSSTNAVQKSHRRRRRGYVDNDILLPGAGAGTPVPQRDLSREEAGRVRGTFGRGEAFSRIAR